MSQSPLANTFGYLLISAYLLLVLYGFVVVLTSRYFCNFPKDSIYTKVHVTLLLILSTAQALSLMCWIYASLVDNFGQVLRINQFPVIGIFSLHMLYFLLFTAQCFFMARIYILSKGNLWMSIPPFTLAFAALGLGLYVAARLRIAGEYTEIFSMKTYILVVDILALSCDIFVTSALCYLLHNSRAALQHNVTNSIINRILVNIINRGGLNLVVAVLIMVFLQLSPRTMLFDVPLSPAGQVTTISVLTTLLSRKSVRRKIRKRSHALANLPTSSNRLSMNVNQPSQPSTERLFSDVCAGKPLEVNVTRYITSAVDRMGS